MHGATRMMCNTEFVDTLKMHDVAQVHVQPHIPTSISSLLNTSKMNSIYRYCVVAMLFYVLQISLPEQKLQLFEVLHNISELHNQCY